MIDLDEVQALVTGAPRATTMAVHFLTLGPDDLRRLCAAAAGNPADGVAAAVTFAGDAARRRADAGPDRRQRVTVGLTADGVRLLEPSRRLSAALPLAFTGGMRAAAARLGDRGPSAPSGWEPPFDGTTEVHAVVILHDGASAGAMSDWVPGSAVWRGSGGRDRREAFGFRDGVSDPVIAGTGRDLTPGNGVWVPDDPDDPAGPGAWRPVRTGEVVLGHRDESGEVAGHPDAAPLEADGSYLVLRKLRQDVDGFHGACRRWAEELRGAWTQEAVEAQLVGRWHDGRPLGGSPYPRDNDFRYGGPDGLGDTIPRSSHIRRSNPRDDPVVPSSMVRRHLLFRRGMPYDDGAHKGMLFMAFCADLQRQFEFVQSQWLGDGATFDLGAERDPLVGNRSGDEEDPASTVSIGDGAGARIRRALPAFVTTRGGEYLLVPSRSALRLIGEGGP